MLGTDLLNNYLDAYDLELELEVEQRLGPLEQDSFIVVRALATERRSQKLTCCKVAAAKAVVFL